MMHTAWIQSKGRIDECPLCISEHGDPNNPNFQQIDLLRSTPATRYPLPCEKHGDPSICLPGNVDAFEIYSLINQQDNYIVRTIGEKIKMYLDLGICAQLCLAWGVDVKETLPKLNILHKELFPNG